MTSKSSFNTIDFFLQDEDHEDHEDTDSSWMDEYDMTLTIIYVEEGVCKMCTFHQTALHICTTYYNYE